ncbi:MAG: exosortase/archaeosortase family protein [Sediminibacterium sp.]|nr:exosortase/archaeosortase family protein [Sediminibacterium sp.]
MKTDRSYILFLLRFLGLFSLLYFGTYAFIGLSAEGGYFIPFLKQIDYVSWYRQLLLRSSETVLDLLGYNAYTRGPYLLYINGKSGLQLVYSCLGFGVLSFWIAYVVTHQSGTTKTKIKWAITGILLITVLNIIRIIVLLLAVYKHWINIAGIDHHTLYNCIVYVIVLLMAFYYRKKVA